MRFPNLGKPPSLATIALLVATAFAPLRGDPAIRRAEFDALVEPAVRQALRKPVTTEGGSLAWGESYLLAALAEMQETGRDPRHAAQFVALADHVLASRDDRQALRDEERGRVMPAWGSTKYSKGRRFAWAVHTGMLAAPLARFAATVGRDAKLKATFGADAARLLRAAEESVAALADEYRDGPGAGEGHVVCPFLGKHLPLNMQNALARTWLAIDDATGRTDHRERIERLARFMKNRMRAGPDGSLVWGYWPHLSGDDKTFEDNSHASINVDFLVLCHERGIVFERADLAAVESTLLRLVLLADDRVGDRVGPNVKFKTYAE
ncbi:MAG: hypothetical protein ACKPB0_12390, partial [Opitutaceae bacterium]